MEGLNSVNHDPFADFLARNKDLIATPKSLVGENESDSDDPFDDISSKKRKSTPKKKDSLLSWENSMKTPTGRPASTYSSPGAKVPSKPISSLQKYSLMRTAKAAKKEFEDMVKRVALNKSLKEKSEGLPTSGLDTTPISCNKLLIGGRNSGNKKNILKGVVAYVEIKSGNEYRNEGTQAELESLGAKVEKNLTKKVTHCFFHGGKMSTFRKAVDTKVPLVSTLWIEECKEHETQVPLKGFEPYGIEKYHEQLPHYLLKSKMRRPMTDSKMLSKSRKKFADRDKADEPADTPTSRPRQMRRPLTDSRILSKSGKKLADRDKVDEPADTPTSRPRQECNAKRKLDVDDNENSTKKTKKRKLVTNSSNSSPKLLSPG